MDDRGGDDACEQGGGEEGGVGRNGGRMEVEKAIGKEEKK